MARHIPPPDFITTDPAAPDDAPVFTGTNVPVRALFESIKANATLDEFLACHPQLTRPALLAALDQFRQRFD